MIHTRIWRPVGYAGVKYLTASTDGGLLEARSTILRLERGTAFRATYAITHDRQWGARSFEVELADEPTQRITQLRLRRRDEQWLDEAGNSRDDLTGCTEIDLQGTPFTRTLGVGGLEVGESRELSAVLIRTPGLGVEPTRVRYTRLKDAGGLTRYRYESAAAEAPAVVSIDAEGFPSEWAGRFKRVAV